MLTDKFLSALDGGGMTKGEQTNGKALQACSQKPKP
jgi:hypothetical protein